MEVNNVIPFPKSDTEDSKVSSVEDNVVDFPSFLTELINSIETSYLVLNEDNTVSKVDSLEEWMSSQRLDNTIASTTVGCVRVSTVFLPVMHIGGCFESAFVFPDNIEIITRYHTHDEAIKGHTKLVKSLIVNEVPKSILKRERRKFSRSSGDGSRVVTCSGDFYIANF